MYAHVSLEHIILIGIVKYILLLLFIIIYESKFSWHINDISFDLYANLN